MVLNQFPGLWASPERLFFSCITSSPPSVPSPRLTSVVCELPVVKETVIRTDERIHTLRGDRGMEFT